MVPCTQKSIFMKWTSEKLLIGKPNASWVQSHSENVLDLLKVRIIVLLRKVVKTLGCEDCCLLLCNALQFTQQHRVISQKTAVFIATTVTASDFTSLG
jgi:hypothetical protein